MSKYLGTAERWFVILSLIFYSSGPLPLILSGGAGQGIDEESTAVVDYTLQQSFFFVNYLISLVLLTLRWKKAIFTLSKDRTIWLLMLLAVVSVMWSFSPQLTRPRSIALVGTSLFGLYIASRFSIREQLKLLGWSCGLIVILSFLFAIIIPYYGTMAVGIHTGAWRGIYVHKNVLGKIMGLSGIVFVLLAMDAKAKRWFPWLGLGLSFALLLLSKSSSATINFLTAIGSLAIYSTFRWRFHLMVPAIIAISILGGGLSWWLNQNSALLLGSIGKDPTLTGRTEMWPHIMEMIWKQPWLGYGYSAFWNDWDSPGAYVWYASRWTPPNSHNGFLDLWLDFGLVGVIVFAIGFFQTLLKSLNVVRVDKYWASFWGLVYLTYLILGNITESALIARNDIFWLLYITISFSLAIDSSSTDKMSIQNL
ncbi:O-antigen ligase family protein [Chamaesiphon minutus]|uniref:Lipid A core-O-antigen ligase-like enyme n=1 Tax=Chamaesiphon minutus (strain ATCC 27169 / PCC 6605) TaxID=1173020 RepID=K9UFI8_CHAP6|nr:O-antigen ligase [Chamaesiphon minutus]AFY93867.1 lipid A core-O-antigen ligase-like enyme [Chamaesiphon minutus PCC 6605]